MGNNVGISLGETFFASMTYAAWCARRAVAFAAISIGYKDPPKHEVHFELKSAFEKVAL